MAYDEFLADRVRQLLKEKSVNSLEKKMMGGLCFMVDNKMCCGLLTDKNTNRAMLMARIGIENYEDALKKPHCSEMNFTGRSMKGYVFISDDGIDLDEDLNYWIQLCLDFNPLAKRSKKRKPKKK
jgi:arylamine N-acetyltransferase